MKILAADIGGTKTLLALAHHTPQGWRFDQRTRVASMDYADLGSLVEHWLATTLTKPQDLSAAGFALAGPVRREGGLTLATATNLPWPRIDDAGLASRLGIPVKLVNDFAAIGVSLSELGSADLVSLQRGTPDPMSLRLVAGAGTGLGTCVVGPAPSHEVFPGEGGHADFAPADGWQAELADWIRTRLGRCSRESILSGPGIARIAAFLHERSPDPILANALSAPEPAAAIAGFAEAGKPAALQVIDHFVSIYGGQLSDLALTALPAGGIYLAGGIAPRWQAHFLTPNFLESFRNKPPMHTLLAGLPLHLITHPEPGLLGAAVAARRMLDPVGEFS